MTSALPVAVGAFLLAFGSSYLQRLGPDHAIYCSLGTAKAPVLCPKPRLNAGWPAPFLFDTPGVSREGQLAFVEDEFRAAPFTATVAFYFLVLSGLVNLVFSLRRRV